MSDKNLKQAEINVELAVVHTGLTRLIKDWSANADLDDYLKVGQAMAIVESVIKRQNKKHPKLARYLVEL